MGSPIDVGGQYPFITFFTQDSNSRPYSHTVPASSNHNRCVDFEFLPFSRMWAAYIELAGIVPLGSSQGQDSRESCDNSRTNWGSLEKRGEGNPKFGALTITLESSGRDRIDKGDMGRHTRD